MKNTGTALLLWFLGGFGLFGFHRMYLGKWGTGFLWLFTGGVFGIGSLIDLFTLGGQVKAYNTDKELQQMRQMTMATAATAQAAAVVSMSK